jgi:hypothetical protein
MHIIRRRATLMMWFCGKFDRMQSSLNCVENWCREISLSVNADKATMVLFTNNRKIGDF